MTPIACVLTGVTPLLGGKPMGVAPEHRTPEEQAAALLYRSVDGSPVIPGLDLFRCLAGAAAVIERSAADLVHAIGIGQSALPIRSPRGWVVDTRTVRDHVIGIPRLRHRPRFDAWSVACVLQVDVGLLLIADAHALTLSAGQRVGLGDERPDRGGPYGRFTISAWEVG